METTAWERWASLATETTIVTRPRDGDGHNEGGLEMETVSVGEA